MEEVIDRTHTTSSPEELAIHFLLRHAECRKALTGPTVEERLHEVLARFPSDAFVVEPVIAGSRQPRERVSRGSTRVAGVTEDDSCAARFSRAYAAARHNLAHSPVPQIARAG